MNNTVLNPVTRMTRTLREHVAVSTQVVIQRPAPRPKKAIAPEAPAKPGVRRVSVHYDFKKNILKVRDLRTLKDEKREAILLHNVSFVVREGRRTGCQPTGKLGFAHGHESFDGVPETFDGAVKWKGDHFEVNGKKVVGASVVRIVGKSMQATGLSFA